MAGLTIKQSRFLEGLLRGYSIKDAGSYAGVSERTAYRYSKDEMVCGELSRLVGRLLQVRAVRLAGLSGLALDVLLAVLADGRKPTSEERWAVGVVLRHGMAVSDILEALRLGDRVVALEESLAQ
jgi:hypothetical protein